MRRPALMTHFVCAHDARALPDYDQPIRRDARHLFDAAVRPADFEIGGRRGPQPEVQAAVARRKISALRQHRLRLPPIAVACHHRRADRRAVRLRALQQHFQPMAGASQIIAQQRGRLVHVHDQDVEVAVVIEIAESDATARVRLGDARPGLLQQFFELAGAEIAKDHARRLVRDLGQLVLDFRIDHAGGVEQIGQAVVIQVHNAGAPADEPRLDAQPGAARHIQKHALAVVAVEHGQIVLEVGLENVEVTVGVVVADAQPHARLQFAVLAQRDAAFETAFGERAVAVVAEQQAGGKVAGHVEVAPAVAIEIGRGGGERVARLHRQDAGFFADIGKGSVAVIAVQPAGILRHSGRMAIDWHIAIVAGGVLSARGHPGLVEHHVVRDEQVEPAVAVVIDPRAAAAVADARVQQAGAFGHIGEGAVAVVVEQQVLAPAGDEKIVEAVVIVIPDGDAGGPHGAAQAGFFGDIGERAVAMVAVEPDRRARRRVLPAPAGEQNDILPAVVVIIDEGDAAAHRIHDVVVDLRAAIDDRRAQAGGGSYVHELGIEGQPGGFAARHGTLVARTHSEVLGSGPAPARAERQSPHRQKVPTGHEFQDNAAPEAAWARAGNRVTLAAMRKNLMAGLAAASGLCLLLAADGPEKIDLAVLHRIKAEAFGTNSKVMDTSFYLTDVHGPRLTGSPQAKAAGEWAVKRLQEWGLSNVKMEAWGPFGRGWSCTHFAAEMKEPEFQPLIGFAQPWSPGTDGPVSGQAMMAVITGPDDLEKFKGKLKGKIVLTAAPHPSEMVTSPYAHRLTDAELAEAAEAPEPTGGNPAALPLGFFRPTSGAPAAAGGRGGRGAAGGRGGAAGRGFRSQLNQFLKDEGVLVVLTPGNGPDGGTVMGSAAGSQDPSQPLPPPSVIVTNEHYNRIARLLEKNIPVTLAFDIQAKFTEPADSFN